MNKYIDIDELRKELFTPNDKVYSYEELCRITEEMPSADVVEVKHRKWEERFDYHHEKFCSKCGIPQLWMNAVVYNYCPNCGADMRERKDND